MQLFPKKNKKGVCRLQKQTAYLDMNYTYILECNDGTLYCGWTNNLEKRIKSHNDGKGAKYTRSRLPVKLVYFEKFDSPIEAQKREREIKKLSRSEKLNLIKNLTKLDTCDIT